MAGEEASGWRKEALARGRATDTDIARASTPHSAITQPRKSHSPLGHIFFMAIARCYSFYYTFAVILIVGA